MTGTLYIISAASGTGKTSLVHALMKQASRLKISISCTTRLKREEEEEDQDYHFVTPEKFNEMIKAKKFLEHAKIFGHLYGTPKKVVEKDLQDGYDVILEIDWQGAEQVRKLMPRKTVSIFILPPSKEVLRQRMENRNQDSPESMERRLATASSEIKHCMEYDYLVVNDDFCEAVASLSAIFHAESCRSSKQEIALKSLLNELTK